MSADAQKSRRQRIAVVGTGIAGNVAARRLHEKHDITVFEASDRIGGHSNTVDVDDHGRRLLIDTGFIVFNDRTYPRFEALLDELSQPRRKSVMSFSVRSASTGLEYSGSSLNGLFAQRLNIARPSFARMLRDILRFNREAVLACQSDDGDATIADYLASNGYSEEFSRNYLVPMTAAIWSARPDGVGSMPLKFLVRFFQNHGLLQLRDRPTWYVVEGGSRAYVERLVQGHRDRIRLGTPVESISRLGDHVQVKTRGQSAEQFDQVFLACHSDQALRLLADSTPAEREVLGAIGYQTNEAVLHTDVRLMPRRRRAWAAWNYHIPESRSTNVSVTYNMNILQGLQADRQYCVTLNSSRSIDPGCVIYRTEYEHPVFDQRAITAQRRHRELNSGNRTFYCGAYWRNGFHEDGVVSALEALSHFEEEQRLGELHIRRAS